MIKKIDFSSGSKSNSTRDPEKNLFQKSDSESDSDSDSKNKVRRKKRKKRKKK